MALMEMHGTFYSAQPSSQYDMLLSNSPTHEEWDGKMIYGNNLPIPCENLERKNTYQFSIFYDLW